MLTITSKYPEMLPDGSIRGFRVIFREEFDNLVLEGSRLLHADYQDKSHAEIIKLIDDDIYKKKYTQRAEDERFNLMGAKVAEVDATIEKANQAMETQKLHSETAQATILELVGLFYSKGLLTDEDLTTITL